MAKITSIAFILFHNTIFILTSPLEAYAYYAPRGEHQGSGGFGSYILPFIVAIFAGFKTSVYISDKIEPYRTHTNAHLQDYFAMAIGVVVCIVVLLVTCAFFS